MIMRPMPLSLRIIWLSRLVTFGLAAVAAGSAAFWALQWSGAATGAPMVALDVPPPAAADAAAVVRALGGAGSQSSSSGASVTVLAASRFALTGVVASSSQRGAALIAVDGKPAKPYAVGSRVGEAWVLQSVQPRRAVLVPAGAAGDTRVASDATLVLELPLSAQRQP